MTASPRGTLRPLHERPGARQGPLPQARRRMGGASRKGNLENLMKNKLCDLNDHLFAQLERLSEEGLSPEQIEKEVQRTDAIVSVSEQIVRNADLQLKAVQVIATHGDRFRPQLPMIGGRNAEG